MAENAFNFIKKRLQHYCFSAKFAKFLRTPFSPAFQRFLLWLAFCLKHVTEKKGFTSEMCHLHDWNWPNGDPPKLWHMRARKWILCKQIFIDENPVCKKIHAKNMSVEEKWIIFRDFMLSGAKKCVCNRLLYAWNQL